jgi:hypothetical protein
MFQNGGTRSTGSCISPFALPCDYSQTQSALRFMSMIVAVSISGFTVRRCMALTIHQIRCTRTTDITAINFYGKVVGTRRIALKGGRPANTRSSRKPKPTAMLPSSGEKDLCRTTTLHPPMAMVKTCRCPTLTCSFSSRIGSQPLQRPVFASTSRRSTHFRVFVLGRE